MRISVCSIAWQPQDRWSREPVVAMPAATVAAHIAATGADAIEWWEPHLRAEPVGYGALPAVMVSGYYDFTGRDPQAAHAHACAVLERARAVGAPAIRIFTGKVRGGDATPEQWATTATLLRDLCVRGAGIALCAELHDWNLMDTPANAERLMRAVDHPAMGLILHPERLTDLVADIDCLRPWIRHVHVQTQADGSFKPGSDWPAVVRALGPSFAGCYSIEHFQGEPDIAVARAIARLRSLEHLHCP